MFWYYCLVRRSRSNCLIILLGSCKIRWTFQNFGGIDKTCSGFLASWSPILWGKNPANFHTLCIPIIFLECWRCSLIYITVIMAWFKVVNTENHCGKCRCNYNLNFIPYLLSSLANTNCSCSFWCSGTDLRCRRLFYWTQLLNKNHSYWDLKVIVLNVGSLSWRTLGFCRSHGAYSCDSYVSIVLLRCCFHQLPLHSRNYGAHFLWLKLLQFRTKLLRQFSPLFCLLCLCISLF